MTTTPVLFTDGLETIDPGESQTIDDIIATMRSESEKVAATHDHGYRASHAKSHGLAVGTLVIPADLEPSLRQGLFATPGQHPVAVRFALGPGEPVPDSVSTHRGMAIKVFDVAGPKLAGHAADTQDFVLASGPVFPDGDARTFLASIKGIEKHAGRHERLKQTVSTTARATNAVLRAVGSESARLDFFGHPPLHPLAEIYYSQAALRFGDYVAKLAAVPVSPDLQSMSDEVLAVASDPDAFAHAVIGRMRSHEVVFELRAQLCTDLNAMPIEDASKPWDEGASPYRTVARIVLPPQEALSPARRAFMDDVMSWSPAHTLAAHRPLGSLMRARLRTYGALSSWRHTRNHEPVTEPGGVDAIPA